MLAALLAQAAAAETRPEAGADVRWLDGLQLRLGVAGIHSVDYGATEVSWLRARGSVFLGGPMSERAAALASFSIEYERPEFEDAGGFLGDGGSGAPVEELIESTLRFGGRVAVRERWFLGAHPYISAKFENGADLSSSLRGGVVLLLEFEPSETFDVMAGLKLGSRLDRSGLYAWPYLRLRWQASDRVQLRIDNARFRVGYALREGIELRAFAGARADRYRLASRDRAPAGPGRGTFSLREATAGVGVRWDASRRVRVLANAGLLFWQRVAIADGDADRFASHSTHHPAPFGSIELELRF